MLKKILLIVLGVCFIGGMMASGEIPQYLSLQGRITKGGMPVASSSVQLRFTTYDISLVPLATTLGYTTNTDQNGAFDIVIHFGTATYQPLYDEEYFIGIEYYDVDTATWITLGPPQRLTAVPYAVTAKSLVAAESGAAAARTVGTVIFDKSTEMFMKWDGTNWAAVSSPGTWNAAPSGDINYTAGNVYVGTDSPAWTAKLAVEPTTGDGVYSKGRTAVVGVQEANQYTRGALGAHNPRKFETTVLPLTDIDAGAYGQVVDGHTYGYLGYKDNMAGGKKIGVMGWSDHAYSLYVNGATDSLSFIGNKTGINVGSTNPMDIKAMLHVNAAGTATGILGECYGGSTATGVVGLGDKWGVKGGMIPGTITVVSDVGVFGAGNEYGVHGYGAAGAYSGYFQGGNGVLISNKSLSSPITVDSNGALSIKSTTHALLFDDNNIETAGSALHLNYYSDRSITLAHGGGRVAIGEGTASPDALLHLSSAMPYLRLEDTDSGNPWTIGVGNSSSTSMDFNIYEVTGSLMRSKLCIREGGRVGLGTTDPMENLHIHNPVAETCAIRLTNGETGFGDTDGSSIAISSSGSLFIQNKELDKGIYLGMPIFMALAPNGNVGIGALVPTHKLEIQGENAAIRLNTGGDDQSTELQLKTTYTGTDRVWRILAGSGGIAANTNFRIYDDTAGQERFSIGSTGNVKINRDLDVGDDLDVDGELHIGTVYPQSIGSGTYYLTYNSGTDKVGYMASSRRYKKNIQPLAENFDLILKAEPRSFEWKESGDKDFGYIAEELEEAGLKNLVIYDQQGRPDAVKYDKVSLYLLEVVKELKAKNDELEARIKVLETK
ncbi:MAG: tail fiber domain-containing protein [Candidatus Saganbacteria bacterium]|nr:tail fiber domain-containing protein [Candidatus Saganbacteria bacterium]